MAQQAGLTPAPTTLVHGDATFAADPEFHAPAFDVIEILPPPAAERLRQLRRRAADAHILMPEHAKLDEANLARITAERHLQRLTAHASGGGFGLAETDARVVAAAKAVDKARGDARRLTELRDARASSWQLISRIVVNVEDWLRSGQLAGTVLEVVETKVKLLNNESGLADAIPRLRKHVARLKADLVQISSAPMPASYARKRAREQILATARAPNVNALIERLDGKLEFHHAMIRSQVFNVSKSPAATAYAEAVDVLSVVCWLFPEAMISRLDAEIGADRKGCLMPEERQRREGETMTLLLAAESELAEAIWLAQSQSLPFEHDSDSSALAVLGLRVTTAPRTLPAPVSDPMLHSYEVVGR